MRPIGREDSENGRARLPGMSGTLISQLRSAGLIIVAMIPWLLAMYTFYWLQSSGTWTADTPHRGKISFIMLASGMAVSFWLYSRLSKR